MSQEILDILENDFVVNEQGEHCLKQDTKCAIEALICSGATQTLPLTSNLQVEISSHQQNMDDELLLTSVLDFNFTEEELQDFDLCLDAVWDAPLLSLSQEQFVANLASGNDPELPFDEVQLLVDEGGSEELTLLTNMDLVGLQPFGVSTDDVMLGDLSISDFLGENVNDANLDDLDLTAMEEQLVPLLEPETLPSGGSSSGDWVILLGALENSTPQVYNSASVIFSMAPSVESRATKRRHCEDDVQSVHSSEDDPETSTSTRPNTLASKRSSANKKLRDDCNEHEASRLEARNHFLLCKIAKLETIRDEIRALVANRLAK